MQERIIRKLFLGFIHIHILHHASEQPVYGKWLMEELATHGYEISPGTLYPMLGQMEKMGLLVLEKRNVGGKLRKYYQTTLLGNCTLMEARGHVEALYNELMVSNDSEEK